MNSNTRRLLIEWLQDLDKRRYPLTTVTSYEFAAHAFLDFLDRKGITPAGLRVKDISDFVLERFQKGNSEETIVDYAHFVSQFFNFHEATLHVRPALFGSVRIRRIYRHLHQAGISREEPGTQNRLSRTASIRSVEELKSAHTKFHPKG